MDDDDDYETTEDGWLESHIGFGGLLLLHRHDKVIQLFQADI